MNLDTPSWRRRKWLRRWRRLNHEPDEQFTAPDTDDCTFFQNSDYSDNIPQDMFASPDIDTGGDGGSWV